MKNIDAKLTSNTGKNLRDANLFDDYVKNQNLADKSLIAFLEDTSYGTKDLTSYQQYLQSTGKTITTFSSLTQNASNVLKSFGAAFGSMAINWAISEAISLAVTAIDNYIHRAEKLKEAAKEAKSAINDIKSEFDTLSSTTNDVKERFAELAQGVKNLGKVNQSRGTLSTDDYNEFLDLSNQLAELFPSLTKGYDDNGNAILNLSGNVDTIVGSLDNLISVQQKIANQQILENMSKVWAGYTVDLSEYNKKIAEAESKVKTFQNALENCIDGTVTITDKQTNSAIVSALSNIGINPYNIDSLYNATYTYHANPNSYLVNNGDYGYVFESGVWDFSALTESQFEQLKNELGSLGSEYEDAVLLAKNQIESANSEMSSYINTWLSTGSGAWNFARMNSDMQNVVKDVLLNSDWISQLPNDIDAGDWDEVSKWLEQEFLYAINKIDDKEIQTALVDAFNGEFTVESLRNTISQLLDTEGFDENNPLIVYLQAKLDNEYELNNRLRNSIRKITDDHGIFDRAEYSNLEEYTSEFTQSEIELWLTATEGAKNASEAIAMYESYLENLNTETARANISKLSSQLTASADSLDTFQSSITSLSDAMTTLLSGTYSSSELLHSIQTINETLSSMGKDINWELIDDLDQLNNVILHVSDTYLESFLADNHIDPDSNFAKLLRNVIDETLRVETAYDSLNNSIDTIQNSYQTLTNAIAEYNSTGYLTLDTLQQVLAIDNEYISYLIDENGQLTLNEQTYQALTAARLDDAKNTVIQEGIQELENIALQNNATAAEKAETANTNFISKIQDGISAAKSWVQSLLGIAEAQDIVNQTADGLSLEDAYQEAAKVNKAAADDIMSAVYAKLDWIDSVASHVTTDFGVISGAVSSSTASAADDIVEEIEDTEKDMEALLDTYLNYYEAQLNAGQITLKNYLDHCRELTEKYHAEGLISEQKYWDTVQQTYEKQLSVLDKVISAVVGRLDEEIDALEAQKDAAESAYQAKIDAVQEEIDRLEEANQARQTQIDLEQAQYELERAMNQRVKKTYNGSEFVYEADPSSIRDAQSGLDDQLYEMNLSGLKAQISSLEDEMDRATKEIDAQIDKLNEYKKQWNSVADEYEDVQNQMYADQVLGADWESDILDGRLDVLDGFKEQYIRIQQAIADAAVNSANAQIDAINAVNNAQTSGSCSNSGVSSVNVGSTGETDGSSAAPSKTAITSGDQKDGDKSTATAAARPADQIVSNQRYRAVANGSGKTLGTFATEADAWAYLVSRFGTLTAHQSYSVSKFASGGIVSEKDSNIFDPIAEALGEDHLVAVKNNELILPPGGASDSLSSQTVAALLQGFHQDDFWQNLQQNIPKLSSIIQPAIQMPSYDFSSTRSKHVTTPVVQNITLTLPNITNNSGYERLQKELKQMQIDAYQAAHRR